MLPFPSKIRSIYSDLSPISVGTGTDPVLAVRAIAVQVRLLSVFDCQAAVEVMTGRTY